MINILVAENAKMLSNIITNELKEYDGIALKIK